MIDETTIKTSCDFRCLGKVCSEMKVIKWAKGDWNGAEGMKAAEHEARTKNVKPIKNITPTMYPSIG
jgi:hypothetical protein